METPNIKAPATSSKQNPDKTLTAGECNFCDEKHECQERHLQSCSVKRFYDKSIQDCAKYKWQRFDVSARKLKLAFHGFDERDIFGIKNPYDFYLASDGRKTFRKLQDRKVGFRLGFDPFLAVPKPESWETFSQKRDFQTCRISVDLDSPELGVYGEDQNLSGFSCSYQCQGKINICLKELEEHMSSVHETPPRFYCKLAEFKPYIINKKDIFT